MTAVSVGPPTRAPFTDLLLTTLATALTMPVGDHALPAAGGWQAGVDTAGSMFQPFVVVSGIVATHSSGPVGDPQGDWQLPYLLESLAGTREAAELLAGRARVACRGMLGVQVEVTDGDYSATFGFQAIRVDGLGETKAITQLKPPVWREQNTVTLWIGKDS